MTPTDAQIERFARTIFEHMTDIDGDDADWLYFREMLMDGAKAALTAAAEVGENPLIELHREDLAAEAGCGCIYPQDCAEKIDATIERCAQVADRRAKAFGVSGRQDLEEILEDLEEILEVLAAAIRALKDKQP